MQNFAKHVFFLLLFSVNVMAKNTTLQKLHPNEQSFPTPAGYEIFIDQVFRFSDSSLDGKILFFADSTLDSSNTSKFFVVQNGRVVSSEPLPGIEQNWRVSEFKALALDSKNFNDDEIRILAIFRIDPPSGPKDSWDQAFVFNITADGKLFFDQKINKKLRDAVASKRPISTIKSLKKYLGIKLTK